MIAIQNLVLERLLDRLEAEGVTLSYSSEDNPALSDDQFPHLSLVESDDAVYPRTMTRKGEQHASKMFSIGIYTNNESGRKDTAERIAAIVDDEMQAMGFVRRAKVPLSNLHYGTVYRIAARYSGVVDQSGRIYQN